MTGADIGMTGAGIGKTRGAGPSNRGTTIPALAALRRWWPGLRRMAAVSGNAAGVRALSPRRRDRSAMTATAQHGVAPHRRLAMAACVLLALAGLAPAPAQAQVEDYISNLGSSITSSTSLEITASRSFSQAFETGSRSGGYPLQEVVLHLFQVQSSGAVEVTIRENSADGGRNVPGGTRYTLTHDTYTASGRNTFTAPSNATLEADTIYHIVAESTGGTATRWGRLTRNVASIVNAGGWDIDFDYLRKSGAAAWSAASPGRALAAAVRGELPAPPPPPVDVLVGNTGKTDNSLRDNEFFKAQSFTTGDAPGGYDLSSVVLEIANPRGRIQVTIRESKADGAPGDIVHDLGRSPSDEGGSLYEWQAPAGAMLEAGTDYHVVARDFSQPGQFRWWETTAEDGTDAGAASGWSIGGRRTSTGGTAWRDRDGSYYQFQIRGTETSTNTPATGKPTIDNAAPRVGDTLTADASGVSDADGPASPAFTWQWIRVSGGTDTRIAGATSASYTVVAADLGATLKVEASFTDDGGTDEAVESAETGTVAAAPPPPLPENVLVSNTDKPDHSSTNVFNEAAQPFTTGNAPGGYDLSSVVLKIASPGSGYEVTIRESGGSGNPGATVHTLTSPPTDLGGGLHEYQAPAGATLEAGTDYHIVAERMSGTRKLWSFADSVGAGAGSAPGWTLGRFLSRSGSNWLSAGLSFKVQIRGTEASTNTPATGKPTISDTAPKVGDTLTADGSGISDADGPASPAFTWQWIRVSGGTDTRIPGATSATYTVVAADLGATLKVEASFRDDGGTDEAVQSVETAAVGEALPTVTVTPVTTPVTEGTDAVFRLARTGDTAAKLQLFFSISETGDMCRGSSCNGAAASASIPAGDASTNLIVKTDDDGDHETDSVVTVTLAANAAYELGTDTTADVTVEDNDNAAPTGTVTIDDTTPMVGETLTADASGVSDPDGPASLTITWRWLRVSGETATEIPGATTASYTVVAADAGATLKAEAAFTDEDGTPETVESAETSAVGGEALPTVTVTPPGTTPVTEGSVPVFRLTRTGDTAARLQLFFSISETGDMCRGTNACNGATTSVSIPAGQASTTLSVRTVDDSAHEADSVVTVTLAANAAYELGTDQSAEVTVEDNDNAAPTGEVTIDDTTPMVGETLTADASGVSDPDGPASLTFTWRWIRVSGGTDTPIPGATAATYTVVAADAGATLKAEAAFTDEDGTAETVESAETDPVGGAPVLSIGDESVDEGDSGNTTLEFTVTLDSAATATVTVDWATSDGTATAGTDYTAGSGTLTFGAGDSSRTVSVTVAGDEVDESDETFEVTLTNPSGATLGDDTATGTITNDDADPKVTLVLTPASILESRNRQSTVTATLDHASSEETTVTVSVAPVAPAVAGDYTLSSNRVLTIAAGATTSTGTVTITAVNNNVHEGDKTVTVSGTATNSQGITAPQSVTLTITDDELPPGLSVADASVDEGDSGNTTMTFTVRLNPMASGQVTVDWATSDGTATAGTDYTAGNGSLTFNAGDSSKTVSVSVTGDDVDEPDEETFTLTLSNASGAMIGDAEATGTIRDDDDEPTVTLVLTPSSITEVNQESTVTARLDHPSSEATTVTVSVAPVLPAEADDYRLSSNRELRIPAGQTESTGTVKVTSVNNAVDAPDKTVTVSGSATNSQGVTAPDDVTLTIRDDDVPGLSVADASVAEGDESTSTTLAFTVTLNPVAVSPVTVDWATADGTARAGTDYTAGNGSLTFNAGDSSKTVSVSVTGDDVDEPDEETFTVTLSSASGAAISDSDGTATGTIRDDDDTPTVTLVLTPVSIDENGGTSTVTARLDHPSSEATTVTVSVEPVSPAVADDYTLSANRELTIPAGATTSTGEVTITAVDNAVDVPDKRVTVSAVAENAQGVTAPQAVTLTITNDDAAVVELHLSPDSISEAGGVSTVTASLSHPSSEETTVTVSVEPESPAEEGDYRLSADRELTIPAGETASTGEVTITAVNNDVDAPHKTVTVSATATNARRVTGPDAVTLTITNDDRVTIELSVSLDTMSGGEGETQAMVSEGPGEMLEVSEDDGVKTVTVTATVTGEKSLGEERTVKVSVTESSGEDAAVDFVGIGELEIDIPAGPPGTSGRTSFDLDPVNDKVDETDAILQVSGRVEGVEGVRVEEAEILLTDDDLAPTRIKLMVTPEEVSEGAGAGERTVTVTAMVEGETRFGVARTVKVSVEGSGEDAAVDFAEVEAFTVTVPAESDSGMETFELTPEDDELDELDETVMVGGAETCLLEVGTDDKEPECVPEELDFKVIPAEVKLTDNDALSLSVTPRNVVVREDAGEAVFTLNLSRPSEREIEVAATFTDGTAKKGEDYRPNEERVVFAKGETEQELRVALVDDEDMERNETFEVAFELVRSEASTTSATCTIVDDEVIDDRERKLEYALASFGRTVVQDLVTAVEDRRWASGTTATLAGTRLPLSEEAVYEALRRHTDSDGDLVMGPAALREMLSRSSFQVSLGGEGEAGGMGADSLVLWGRGSRSWSAGRLDSEVGTQGEVLSGQLGVEFRVREDTLVGVMLNGSGGEVEFDGALDTEVETDVLGVHPYAQWSPRRGLRTWAMVGYGAGEATLTDEYSVLSGADLEMMMAAGGGSHDVASVWGIDWSLGTNGFVVQLDADEVRFDGEGQAALVPAVQSEVWQMRLLLEGSAGEDFGGVEGLRGNVELAARVDGGDAESGLGMEVGGGVGYGRADLGIEVDASGRVLLSHEEEGLEDAGVSLALEVDPGAPGRGPYFALAPSWGNAASGARSMWEDRQPTVGGSGGGARFEPEMRLSSELGYAAPTPLRRGTLTTYGAFSSAGGTSRQYRVGRRLELGIASMSLEAERYESAGVAPEHGVWLRSSIRF